MTATSARPDPLAHRLRRLLQAVLVLPWLLAPLAAQAIDYTFPGNMPAGCTGSNGNYTCPGGGSLGYGDTVTIAAPKPATITITGSFTTNTSSINAGGNAGDLTLIVQGVLTLNFQAVIHANVTANSVNDVNGYARIGGSLTATSGGITLLNQTTVGGAVTATGAISVGQEGTVGGGATSSGSSVALGYAASVAGPINASGNVTLAQNASAGSTLNSNAGNLDLGYAATASGDISATLGTITLGQNAVASACVTARQPNTITLGYQATAGGVCCGGSCSNSCVANNSTYAMPAACAASLVARYGFEEAFWSGSTGELNDTANYGGGPYDGRASSTAIPSGGSGSPARSGDPGTCRYATLPGSTSGGGVFTVPSVPVSTASGAKTSVSFWMYWDGSGSPIPIGWSDYVLIIASGYIGFNTNNSDLYGATTGTLANGWHHVTAIFTNGSVTGNRLYIDGVARTLTQAIGSPNLALAKVTTSMTLGGDPVAADSRLTGRLDEVRVYNGALTASEVSADYNRTQACTTLLAQYRFEESAWNGSAGELKDSAGHASGPFNGLAQGSPLPTPLTAGPARASSPGTCGYASLPGPANNGGNFAVTGLPVLTGAGEQNSVSFWMYWNGTSAIPISWNTYDLWFNGGWFGFNTTASDIYGISSTGLANGWHHVVAVFTNGSVTANRLYIDGVLQTLSQRLNSPSLSLANASSTLQIGGYGQGANAFRFQGRLDELKVYRGALSAAQVTALYTETHTCPVLIDHLEIQHASGNGLTCTPSTLTVRACQDAACTTLYTGGVSGTLAASGAGMTVNWPSTAAFTIASGSSSTTDTIHVTTPGSVLLSTTGLTPAPTNPTTCNFGSPACTFTAADAGLFFDVPNHRAEVSNSVAVTAVKKADNSAACVPAFASVSKAVNFKCAYVNPASGTQAVRVGGSALNSGNSAGAACDSSGQAVTLAFDATGKATTPVIYADAGTVTLTGTYTGSGTDAGLVMTGSDTFTAAPYTFTVAGPAPGNLVAGIGFAGSVTAKNYLGNTMPNFGRESAPEGATLGWVRTQPQGSAAVNGSFSGSLGSVTNGVATAGTLKWSEVGRGELTAVLASGSYLGSGMTLAGATVGAPVPCAAEWGTCVLPAGVTATVYYGANGSVAVRSGMTGNVWCANDVFGDPLFGTSKNCWYVVTSGASSASTGAVGPFIPHHFDVAAVPACSSSFSYAGQPFAATVTARNANNATTLNYDGSANTSPNFAKVTTLADAPALGLGTWSNASVPVAAFALGVANATPSYAFTTKTTAPQSLVIRATDSTAVSSLGFAEPTMPLRSGRLSLSNAFGSEKAALAIPVQAQYWSGLAWVQNSADSCTSVPATAVVRAAYRDGRGAASTAWTSSASAITLTAGAGTLTFGAPSPTMTGSLDFSLNLGATTTDQSCLAAHPASTGAGLAWLRSQYGSSGACGSAWDRDPSARATFGIYSPETRKTIHVRELF